jgi:hypothetical protein
MAQIPNGPNQGVFYAIAVPIDALARVRVNREALSVGTDFYFRQPTNAPAGKCNRSQVVPFVPLAEDHEGVTLSPTSHAGVFKNELNRLVPQAVEGVVSLNDIALFVDRANVALAPGKSAAATAAMDSAQGGTVPPVPYCTFRYF